MDDLDKQLAELQLIANAELMKPQANCNKKIGPAVPPKPKKQQPQPLVPQSYSLKQQMEPLYASRLQTAMPQQAQLYSNIGPTPQPLQNVYSNLPRGYTRPPENTYSNMIYSNLMHHHPQHVYANGGIDELPPPPPPVDMLSQYATATPCIVNCNMDELPPPPSPVSSSYSELRRATEPLGEEESVQNCDYNFLDSSNTSTTYESIYEPINPRPPSQMSARSNYSSLYHNHQSKEQVVDSLTDMLVQNMHHHHHHQQQQHHLNQDEEASDCFGVCAKCKESVVGANSGCTAMEQIWHTACFTCHHCAINLQGKPFYPLDGKPYCEEDYLNTLEKCCVCTHPILDRILRATGKPYHPKCFTCVMCGKSLDGIPFTVDATNQIHCIEDFHKKFAPRCCVCKQPIMPEPGQEETVRVVALDRSFHIQCYKCEDCGLLLSSEAEGRGCYPLDDHVLCKSCNAKRVQQLTNHMTTEL